MAPFIKSRRSRLRRYRPVIFSLVFLALAGVACFWGLKRYAARLAEAKLSESVAAFAKVVDVSWREVEVRLLSSDVVVRGLVLRRPNGARATIASAVVYDFYRKSVRPNYAAVKINDLHIDVNEANFGPLADDIKALGYSTLESDVHLNVFYDAAAHIFYLNNFDVLAHGAGRMRMRMIVDQVFPALSWQVALATVVVREADLTYHDGTLLKKLVESAWRKEKRFMIFMVDELNADLRKARRQTDTDVVRSTKALKDFLEKPQKLEMSVKLRQPLSLSHIVNARKISDLLQMIDYRFAKA